MNVGESLIDPLIEKSNPPDSSLEAMIKLIKQILEGAGMPLTPEQLSTLEGENLSRREKVQFSPDVSPESVSRDTFRISIARLRKIINSTDNPYNCYSTFNRWLRISLDKSPEKRIYWLKSIGISDQVMNQIDLHGDLDQAEASFLNYVVHYEGSYVNLLIAFFNGSDVNSEMLLKDLQIAKKYVIQNNLWA